MLSYGFYNSINHDRVYDAEEFSSFLDGIVYDGIYEAVGNKFYVEPYEGLSVSVDTGRAWFNHTWTLNTTKLYLDLDDADPIFSRIDAVVIEVNKIERKNFIKVVTGEPKSSPTKPTLVKEQNIIQHAIAYVTVEAMSTSIPAENIEYVVDTSETPLCSALALAGIPSGGKIGQVLAKESSASGAVGWYDVNNLPYEKWYLCSGVTENNVLGAYKFIGAVNESVALKSVNENTDYPLTKSDDTVTWTANEGFLVPINHYLNNESLRGSDIVTVLIKYSDVLDPGTHFCCLSGGYGDYKCSYVYASLATHDRGQGFYPTGHIGACSSSGSSGSATRQPWETVTVAPSGIIGVTFDYGDSDCNIYMDGQLCSKSQANHIDDWQGNDRGKILGYSGLGSRGKSQSSPFKVQYAVFLNCSLTDEQHNEMYRNINSDFMNEQGL